MQKITLPPKTAAALGEEAAEEFAQWAGNTFALRQAVIGRDEFGELLTQSGAIVGLSAHYGF